MVSIDDEDMVPKSSIELSTDIVNSEKLETYHYQVREPVKKKKKCGKFPIGSDPPPITLKRPN